MGKILYYAMTLLGRLPLSFHYACGRVFSWIAAKLLHYRSKVVMTNIARSFPELGYKETQKIYDSFYDHLGKIIAESFFIAGSSAERLKKNRFLSVEGLDSIKEYLENSPGTVVMASHLGNWELIPLLPAVSEGAVKGERVVGAHKKLTNRSFEYAFGRIRKRYISAEKGSDSPEGKYLESKKILRYCLTHKDDHLIYLFITDQFPYKGAARMDVGEFMNQKTYSLGAAAQIAVKLHHSVAYLSVVRDSENHSTISLKPICEDASEMSAEQIMKQYYKMLEEDIRRNPEQYLWSHKRWK